MGHYVAGQGAEGRRRRAPVVGGGPPRRGPLASGRRSALASRRHGPRSPTQLLLAGALALWGAPWGCGEGSTSDRPQPEYQGAATDEVFEALLDAQDLLREDDSRAARFTVPTPGQSLPAGSPPTFTWVRQGTTARHLPPVTADVFLVQATIPGRAAPKEVLTTLTSWTPDADTWQQMQAAAGPIELTLTSFYVRENRVTEGPFRTATPVGFTVTP